MGQDRRAVRAPRPRRARGAADPAAPALRLLSRPPPRLRVEPGRPRGPRPPAFDAAFDDALRARDRSRGRATSSAAPAVGLAARSTRVLGLPRPRARRRCATRSTRSRRARDGRPARASAGRILRLVLEHELMHHETLLYMLQELDRDAEAAPGRTGRAPALETPRQRRVAVRGPRGPRAARAPTSRTLAFGWDNEFPAHDACDVAAFAIDALAGDERASSCEFVEAGGYGARAAGAPEDWAWRRGAGWSIRTAGGAPAARWSCAALVRATCRSTRGATGRRA